MTWVSRDDLRECWCCGGLSDRPSLCAPCTEAGCNRFDDLCLSDHEPALPDGGRDVDGAERLWCWIVTYPNGVRRYEGAYPVGFERHSLGEVSVATWSVDTDTDREAGR